MKLKPVEFALSDIEDVKLESFKDNLSGAMTHTPLSRCEGSPDAGRAAKEGDAAENDAARSRISRLKGSRL